MQVPYSLRLQDVFMSRFLCGGPFSYFSFLNFFLNFFLHVQFSEQLLRDSWTFLPVHQSLLQEHAVDAHLLAPTEIGEQCCLNWTETMLVFSSVTC